MKGICFIEPLHGKTVKKIKVQTRRIINPQPLEIVCSTIIDNKLLFEARNENDASVFIEPRYKVGDVLYLKEPYYELPFGGYQYKFDENIFYYEYKNKLFMPASAARHFIKIIAVRGERLQDISDEDCIKEGIYQTECIAEDYFEPVYENGYNATSKKSGILCIQYDTPREAYAALIDAINGKDTWDNNPWVWVYDYELIDRKEVQI